MEVIYVIIYLIICVAIAYFVGLEKRIGFGYAFLFSFLLTPILGIIISFLTQKIKLNEKANKAFRIIGGLLFYPAITFAVLFLFFFYQESKTIGNKVNLPDSIKIKKSFNNGSIKKIVYSRGILLAELHSGKFELINDSLIYKSYTTTPQIKETESQIIESSMEIDNLEKEIEADLNQNKKPASKIKKYNDLIKKHNLEVNKVNSLIKIKNAEYRSYKVEQPSWWYFMSNRSMVYFFIVLLILSLIGKFMLDIGKRKI